MKASSNLLFCLLVASGRLNCEFDFHLAELKSVKMTLKLAALLTTAFIAVKSAGGHTPFLPEGHGWPGAPEFGADVRTNVSVVRGGRLRLRCPIGRVQDDAVSIEKVIFVVCSD